MAKTFEEMISQAREAIINSSEQSSIYIGSDSLRYKKSGKWFATYSTVIILHKDSKHGANIFHFTETHQDYGSLKQRLMTEVGYAVNAASEIIDYIGNRTLEIHLDLNASPTHKSNIAVKEAIGYVQGSFGFAPKIKPFSFAATHAADHVVRH